MQSVASANRTEPLARHAAALLGLSIPISVALDNILLVLVAVLWLAGGDLKRKLADIAANPVALAALALFGMLAAGLLYGSRYPGDGLRYLVKYADLLFIPILITLFRDPRTREVALRWFCVALVLTFVVADMVMLGLLEENAHMARAPISGRIFKHSITHGLLAAFAAFLLALLAQREPHWPQRTLFIVLALVAVKNVLIVSISRTAYLVLALLTLYYFFIQFGRRGLVIACLTMAALVAGGYGSSEAFRERLDTVVADTGQWRSQWPSRESVTVRQEWYRHSLDIVRENPLFGSGTGSFPRAYAEAVDDRERNSIQNPHNEYLLIAVQAGIIGLALLLHLFWRQAILARRLASPLEMHLARGLVITMAVGCLFNSLLLDHTEGLFYAWFTGLLYGGLRSPPPPGGGGQA